MTKSAFILLIVLIVCIKCQSPAKHQKERLKQSKIVKNNITCTDNYCEGTYFGAEFVDGSDIAHQFSNQMSEVVGDKLKELYGKGKYVKVNFAKIAMSTEGMGSGKVSYKLYIPFEKVSDKCLAYTSFDHVGGWNHEPELEKRKSQLNSVLLKGDKLEISDLKSTPEGLQEYWIQWRNKEVQEICENN